MGYYVRSDYSNYYVGDKINSTDIAVTERPYSTCAWDGAAWVYDLAATRIIAKNIYTNDMSADIALAMSESADPIDTMSIIALAFMRADVAAYADNVAQNCPFIDGYRTITGETKAACAATVATQSDLIAGVLGAVLAQRNADYALMDAAATGAAIIAVTYSRPF